MRKAFLDDVILMHTTCSLAAGDLSEEGGVRQRHEISGCPEAGRGRRGASSGRGGSDYMVDAIFVPPAAPLKTPCKSGQTTAQQTDGWTETPANKEASRTSITTRKPTPTQPNVNTPPNGQLKQHNVMSLKRRKAPPEPLAHLCPVGQRRGWSQNDMSI